MEVLILGLLSEMSLGGIKHKYNNDGMLLFAKKDLFACCNYFLACLARCDGLYRVQKKRKMKAKASKNFTFPSIQRYQAVFVFNNTSIPQIRKLNRRKF